MEPEIKPVVSSRLNTVTPLSKLLTIGLIIILPFLGFWIGVKFDNKQLTHQPQPIESPVKSVTEELTVLADEELNTLPATDTSTNDRDLWERYVHPAGFALMIPAEAHVQDSFEEIIVKDIYGYLDINIYYRENLGGKENVSSYIAEMYGSDCEVKLENEDIMGYGVSTYSIFGNYPGYTGDCRNGKKTKLLYSHIDDLAVTWIGSYDAGNHLYMLETIHISTPAYGE